MLVLLPTSGLDRTHLAWLTRDLAAMQLPELRAYCQGKGLSLEEVRSFGKLTSKRTWQMAAIAHRVMQQNAIY